MPEAKPVIPDTENHPDRDRYGLLAAMLGGRLYRMTGLIFILAITFRYFDAVSRVLLLAFVAVIIGIAFNALVVRLPVRRTFGSAIVALLTFGTLGVSAYFGGNAVANQVRAFVRDLPSIIESAESWASEMTERLGIDLELTGPQLQEIISSIVGEVSGGTVVAGTFGVLEIVAISLLVLMGAFFVVAQPNKMLLTPLMKAVPQRLRPAYRRMFSRLGERLSGWLIGTLISMVVVGVLTAVALWLLGIPYALLLGLLNGFLNIIPLIGAWIGGLIAVIVTLFANPAIVVWVIIIMIAIQELEGNLVRPIAMSGTARIHPFLTLLSLLLFSSMFGFLGAVLSIPITLAIITLVEVLWVEETLDSGDDVIEPVVEE